jgi:hypothetical protein
MGNNLSQMPGTQELGQSLQTGDLTDIASALEELTAHLSDLDTSTQEQLVNEMSSSSQNISSLETEEIQTLSQNMDDVASQIQKQADETGQPQNQSVSSLEGNISAQEALDKVVSDLRTLANINVDIPGGGAGQGDTLNQNSTTEPVTRIQGGSDVIELPTSADNQAGLLTPSHDQSSSDQQANESMNLTLDTGNEIINSSIIPSIYPWKLRYVVSKYFLNR